MNLFYVSGGRRAVINRKSPMSGRVTINRRVAMVRRAPLPKRMTLNRRASVRRAPI